jgi:DUF1009 family protein
VGARTVELAAAAGLAGIAVEAGSVLVLGRDEAVRAADAHGIAIEGLPGPGAESIGGTARESVTGRVLGRRRPSRRDRADIVRGLQAVARLAPFGTGGAVVVARALILAFTAEESAAVMLDRVRGLRQWGMGATRRIGVLACAVGAGAPAVPAVNVSDLLQRAAVQGLAGVVVTGHADAIAAWEDAGPRADAHGLFLVVATDLAGEVTGG